MLSVQPYSSLKQPAKDYEIMLLRDVYENSFCKIAKKSEISLDKVIEIYESMIERKLRLYICHLSLVQGHSDDTFFVNLAQEAYNCYSSRPLAIAYFEKRYKNILREYRAGEPGMSPKILNDLPPLKKKWNKQTISLIVKLKEEEKKNYIQIGKQLKMTRFKAQSLYEDFYHKKCFIFFYYMDECQHENVFDRYWDNHWKYKRRFEMIRADYPDLFDGNGNFLPEFESSSPLGSCICGGDDN